MHPTPSGAVCDYASAVRFGGAGATHTQRSSECDTTASPSVECAQHGSTRVSETNTSVHPLDHVSDIAVSRASLSSCRLSARTTARDSIVHDTRPPLPTDAFAHTVDGATPAACAALSSDHLTAMTSKESDGAKPPPASTMSSAAKPYIPSYLAAVKKPVQPGGTGVVPIRVSDRPKLDWMTCSTVSNSLMDQESTSSWADDDENFLLSVTKTQRSMHVTASTRPSGDEAGRQASPREKGKPSGQGKGGKGGNGGGGGGEKGGSASRRGHKGKIPGPSAHPTRPRLGGNSNNNNSNNNATKGNNDRQASSSTTLSGGRFDVLANPAYMRHV